MSFEDYSRNVRGVNEGKDFDVSYLVKLLLFLKNWLTVNKREIYDAIKGKEILMPEEHGGNVGFSHRWREIQGLSESATPFIPTNSSCQAFDRDMFLCVWGPILASILYGTLSRYVTA